MRDHFEPQNTFFTSLNRPVLSCLLPHFSEADAARLMLLSHAAASLLLSGYSFAQHVFTPLTAADLTQAD